MNLNKFRNPGKEYRGVPFWSWNDDLDETELRKHVRLMKDAGLGGFFMHSRIGLITPYISSDRKTLSEEWMRCIKAAVDEAKKTDMLAYLYDEDRWPSGFAGGIIPVKGKRYKMKVLECEEVNGKPKFKVKIYDNMSWYNNYSYIDTLNKDAVLEFIKSTYEAYYKSVGDEFGKVIPAIFTDEPNYLQLRNANPRNYYIPWTEEFPDYFSKKKGYDIRKYLVSLFYEIENWQKIRFDYWQTATELFLESFTKTIYDWCSKHNIAYTGHYLSEDTLQSQIGLIGKAMPHYEYMHIPGIDHLSRNINNLITVKQVSSVAHQFGKKRVLSETYGCSGWNLTFEAQKWIGDWQYVLGVNLLTQHLALYSMKGCRKRDYPPSLYYQEPWWRYHKVIADYFARLSWILTQGKFSAKFLVIHPIESAWAVYSPRDKSKVEDLNKSFVILSELLCGLHKDYDFGDEGIIEKYAKAEDGKFKIGEMEYAIIILPPSITLRKSTVKLLKEFLNENGKIIAIRPLPYLIDGEESCEIEEIFKNNNVYILDKAVLYNDRERIRLKEALDIIKSDVKICDKDNGEIESIYYQHRIDGKKHIYFFTNTSQYREYKDVKIYLDSKGKVFKLNLLNGDILEIPSEIKDGYTIIHLDFVPVDSYLIMVDTTLRASLKQIESREKEINVKYIPLKDTWDIKRTSYNALTIDYCEFKIEDGKFSRRIYVLNAQKEIEKVAEGKRFTIRYRFHSKLKDRRDKEIYLVLEEPNMYKIKVNGKEIRYIDSGWWVDISFKKIDIKGFLKYGENIIEISGIFKNPIKPNTLIFKKGGTEIESCYIVGDFAVRHNNEAGYYLDEENLKVKTDDLINQGYPFFAGSVVLSQEIDIKKSERHVRLDLGNIEAVVAKVTINDKEAGMVFGRPYILDISEFVKEGKNRLEIELTNSNRNLLGPHHNPEGELLSVGPGSFSGEKSWISNSNWTDEYLFIKFGLMPLPKILKFTIRR